MSRRSKNARRRAIAMKRLWGLCAVGARLPGNVAWKLVVEAAEDLAIVIAAPLEAEERPVLGGRDKIERAVEARIVGLSDVNLG